MRRVVEAAGGSTNISHPGGGIAIAAARADAVDGYLPRPNGHRTEALIRPMDDAGKEAVIAEPTGVSAGAPCLAGRPEPSPRPSAATRRTIQGRGGNPLPVRQDSPPSRRGETPEATGEPRSVGVDRQGDTTVVPPWGPLDADGRASVPGPPRARAAARRSADGT